MVNHKKGASKFLFFAHVIRRPCWCTKQWRNVAQVFHNITKTIFAIVLDTNMAAVGRHMKTENTERRVSSHLSICAVLSLAVSRDAVVMSDNVSNLHRNQTINLKIAQ